MKLPLAARKPQVVNSTSASLSLSNVGAAGRSSLTSGEIIEKLELAKKLRPEK